MFSMVIQKVSVKIKEGYCIWRLCLPTPTIPILSELQRGAYLGRTAVNLNSDAAALSQSLRPAKMLADLLPWELMLLEDCDHKNAMKSKALDVSFLFSMQRDKVPQRQWAKTSSLTCILSEVPTEILHSSPALAESVLMTKASSGVTRSLIYPAAPWFSPLARWPKEARF